VLLLAAGACAPAAWGQGAEPQRTDPDATSPAGVIYEIPLDSGRKDGAPHRDGAATGPGGSAGTGGNGTGGSAGGGTSGSGGGSGAGAPAGGENGDADGARASSSGAGRADLDGATSGAGAAAASSIHSENGFGSSTEVPTAIAAVSKNPSMQAESSSRLPEYLLLGLLVAVGVYLGCVSFAPRFRA